MSNNKLGIFLAGGLTGAAIALLCAPRSGRESRAMVSAKLNEAWGEAQDLGAQGAAGVQQAYQSAVTRGQDVVQNVASKGQEVYGAASSRVQEVVGSAPAGVHNDELREKIEAARQRIAAQVAENAERSQAADDGAIPVTEAAAETAYVVIETTEPAAAEGAQA